MADHLLAVDLGLRAGLASFDPGGRLRWFRSHNFGAIGRLRRAVPALLDGHQRVVLEGDRALADVWTKMARRRDIAVETVSAEIWRERLLLSREQRSGADAKRHADQIARRVIAWSGLPGPKSLRHDAAEAILIGLWAVLKLGWLAALPSELR